MNVIKFHYIMLICAFTMWSYRVQIMFCSLDPTSEFLLFISAVWTNVSHYKICNYVFIFVHSDMSAIQIRKRKASNSLWKSHFVTYMDVSLNLEIISVIHKFASYSSPNHYDILLTISHYPIVNMDGIRSSIRFVHIHIIVILKAVSNFQNNFRDSN